MTKPDVPNSEHTPIHPKLRYSGDLKWETALLKDLSDVILGGTPDTSVKEYWENGSIPWMSSGEIHKKFIDNTDACITQAGYENSNATIIPPKCVLVALAGQGKTRGTVAINNIELSTNQSIAAIKTNSDLDPFFLLYTLENNYNLLRSISSGSGRAGLNKELLQSLTIHKSERINYQKQIGNLFRSIDVHIKTCNDKYESMLKFKQACLLKIFPKHKENIPQLRFNGFLDEWKHSSLGEVGIFSKGRGYSKSDIADVGEPLLLYGSLYTGYETLIYNTQTSAKRNKESIISQGHEVVIPASGETKEDIARASAIVERGIIIGGDLNILIPKQDFDPGFLAYSITYGPTKQQLIMRAQGATIVHLHSDAISECEISYPSLPEQQKISKFLESVDRQIRSEQQKYEVLCTLKAALLQRMLI